MHGLDIYTTNHGCNFHGWNGEKGKQRRILELIYGLITKYRIKGDWK